MVKYIVDLIVSEELKRFFICVGIIVFICIGFLLSVVYAKDTGCRGSFINLLNEIRWEGIFPIQLAGVPVKVHLSDPASVGLDTDPDKLSGILCICSQGKGVRVGIKVSYWEPARLIDVTKIPYCFPALGMHMKIGKPGVNTKAVHDSSNYGDVNPEGSGNSHYFIFNVFAILDIFVDIPCIESGGFDIMYISEIDPLWNNDIIGSVLNPEAILFANPVAQAACLADASMAALHYPSNALFWCVGAWGSAYPLAGNTDVGDTLQNSALLMARTIYRNARLGLLWDPGIHECESKLTPIWVKSNYKVHQVRPKVGPIVSLGRPTIMWEFDKNPVFGTRKGSPDNFSYVMFRRVKCCLGVTIPLP